MTIGDTTTTGPKKKKKSSVPPRRSELAYLLELGRSLDDAESRRSPSTLNVVSTWSGPNLLSEHGRQCAHEKKHFLPWLRGQGARADNVGALARALERHEANLAEGEAPAGHWVAVASRIIRGEVRDEIGRAALRQALDGAREGFRVATVPEERAPALEAAA